MSDEQKDKKWKMRTALHHRHGKLGMTEECSNVQTSV
jgi:hypothetical protein